MYALVRTSLAAEGFETLVCCVSLLFFD